MTNPENMREFTNVWSSQGPSYNWFDKHECWAGLELRLKLSDTTRGYYDYLVNTQKSVMSGSSNWSENPK